VEKIQQFQVAIPSWALGAGGTRFGRFSFGGEPANLEQKIDDVGIIHALTQDQADQKRSYKHGSLSNINADIRAQAIEHNQAVIDYGKALDSKSLTVWLSDGSNFPGQSNFKRAFQNTQQSLKEIYSHLPEDWQMLVEYKPYEPNFYSTVISDWGTSLMLAEGCGEKAFTL